MSKTLKFGLGESGRTIKAKVGDTVVLSLPENPTTGVRWNEADLPSTVELVEDSYSPSADSSIGASNVRILRLMLKEAGRHALKLSRMQVWSGPSSRDSTFELILIVSD